MICMVCNFFLKTTVLNNHYSDIKMSNLFLKKISTLPFLSTNSTIQLNIEREHYFKSHIKIYRLCRMHLLIIF